MANSLSSKKRSRQSENGRRRNRARKETLKVTMRGFNDAIASGDNNAIQDELKKTTKALDKAGTKGILHRNNINRRKASLAKAANRVAASA